MRVFILMVLLLPLVCQAEYIVYLVDGGKMVAKRVSKKGGRYVLHTQLGSIEIPVSRVRSVESDIAVSGEYPGKPGYGARYGENNSQEPQEPKKEKPAKKLTPAEQQKLMAEINQKIEAKRQDIFSTNSNTDPRARKEFEDYKRSLVQEYRAKGVDLDYKN